MALYLILHRTRFEVVLMGAMLKIRVFYVVILNQVVNSYPSFKVQLALPVSLYGSETWTIKASDARRITAAEMKHMRRTAGYTWTDYKTNSQITKELKITPILDKLLEYNRSWIQRVNRMPRNRLPTVMKHYSPTGRRNHGRGTAVPLLDGVGGERHAPLRFTPEKETRWLGGPQRRSQRVRNSPPPTGIRSTDRPAQRVATDNPIPAIAVILNVIHTLDEYSA